MIQETSLEQFLDDLLRHLTWDLNISEVNSLWSMMDT